MAASAGAQCSINAKTVVRKYGARLQVEGAGFAVRRVIGGEDLTEEETDPFLLLDELPRTCFAAGEHPGAPLHARVGMLSACYIKEGTYGFNSTVGQRGSLDAGDCQWVHAGGGLQLAEGCNHPGGVLHGFQLFVNLPVHLKKTEASLSTCKASEAKCNEDVSVKVLAGECSGVRSSYQASTPIQFLDFSAQPGGCFEHELPAEMTTALVYVYKGSFVIGPQAVGASVGDVCLLWERGSSVWFKNVGVDVGGIIMVAGTPLKQPIFRSGTVVQASRPDLQRAIRELQLQSPAPAQSRRKR